MSKDMGAPLTGRAATATQPSPAVSGKAGIPSAVQLVYLLGAGCYACFLASFVVFLWGAAPDRLAHFAMFPFTGLMFVVTGAAIRLGWRLVS